MGTDEGEHLFDVLGLLSVGCQRDLHLFEHQAVFHQSAGHHQLGLAQISDRRCGAVEAQRMSDYLIGRVRGRSMGSVGE